MVIDDNSKPNALGLRSPAHGYCDDPPTRRLLRARPPRPALAWAERQLGGRVVSARALRGGMSSAVHLLTFESAGGTRERVVLRRYVRPELNVEDPGIAAREARILRFAEAIEVPTPRLLAFDQSGAAAGTPSLLMSLLRGRVDWWPKDIETWLGRLAELLPRIHAAALPPPGVIPSYRPYQQVSYRPPSWARLPKVWEQAVEILNGPAPDLPAVFIQRDFHPGNVLWWRGAVSGVVDWQSASIGPAAVDVGHCRANLLGFSRSVADRFTRLWEKVADTTYHPWVDVVTVMDFLDDLHDGWGSERLVVEDVLASAVRELT
jgi:aminoglycoside phosphotransferase (APT) family kinase protein